MCWLQVAGIFSLNPKVTALWLDNIPFLIAAWTKQKMLFGIVRGRKPKLQTTIKPACNNLQSLRREKTYAVISVFSAWLGHTKEHFPSSAFQSSHLINTAFQSCRYKIWKLLFSLCSSSWAPLGGIFPTHPGSGWDNKENQNVQMSRGLQSCVKILRNTLRK